MPEEIQHGAEGAGMDSRLGLLDRQEQGRRTLKTRGQEAERTQRAVRHVEGVKAQAPRRIAPDLLAHLPLSLICSTAIPFLREHQRQLVSVLSYTDGPDIRHDRGEDLADAVELFG